MVATLGKLCNIRVRQKRKHVASPPMSETIEAENLKLSFSRRQPKVTAKNAGPWLNRGA